MQRSLDPCSQELEMLCVFFLLGDLGTLVKKVVLREKIALQPFWVLLCDMEDRGIKMIILDVFQPTKLHKFAFKPPISVRLNNKNIFTSITRIDYNYLVEEGMMLQYFQFFISLGLRWTTGYKACLNNTPLSCTYNSLISKNNLTRKLELCLALKITSKIICRGFQILKVAFIECMSRWHSMKFTAFCVSTVCRLYLEAHSLVCVASMFQYVCVLCLCLCVYVCVFVYWRSGCCCYDFNCILKFSVLHFETPLSSELKSSMSQIMPERIYLQRVQHLYVSWRWKRFTNLFSWKNMWTNTDVPILWSCKCKHKNTVFKLRPKLQVAPMKHQQAFVSIHLRIWHYNISSWVYFFASF